MTFAIILLYKINTETTIKLDKFSQRKFKMRT